MENVAANEPGCYQASVGNKNQLNKVMDSLLNKVTAWLCWHAGRNWRSSLPRLCREMWQINTGGRKEAISLTCPQWRVNGLIPPIEITAPDCTHQKLSCITLKRQQLNVYPCPPSYPQPLCLTLLCIIPDENIICLLSVCLSHTNPNPQKWQLSYTGIIVAFPAPSFNQERLITRDQDCYSFVATHLRDGLIEEKQERESVRKTGEGR